MQQLGVVCSASFLYNPNISAIFCIYFITLFLFLISISLLHGYAIFYGMKFILCAGVVEAEVNAIGQALLCEDIASEVKEKVEDYKKKLNLEDNVWKELKEETNPTVLAYLLWEWLEQLKVCSLNFPIITVETYGNYSDIGRFLHVFVSGFRLFLVLDKYLCRRAHVYNVRQAGLCICLAHVIL